MRSALILVLFLATMPAQAETIEIVSGTGFFVSPDGDVVTNEHVVESCKSLRLKANDAWVDARVKATDKTNDLALLEANFRPYYIATLRYEQNFKPGDEVTVLGFPIEGGRADQFRMRTAKIIDTKGPSGQPDWLQFTQALKKGNSGGPLLDTFGNVIGVVRGKASFVEITYELQPDGTKREIKRGQEQSSDIAITLPVLSHFLQQHQVNYSNMLQFSPLSDTEIYAQGQRYIVNIQCFQ